MIDTVILRIYRDKLTVVDLKREGVDWSLQGSFPAYQKFVRNPSSRELHVLSMTKSCKR
jgi:hypothetical protein